MQKLYLKNFKGFEEEIIELEDICFLVGENSTGKTSFLQAINILSGTRFWRYGEIDTDETEFGYFSEILSQKSDENFFYIGVEKEIDGKPSKICFKFGSLNEIPVIKEIKIYNEPFNIKIKINPKTVEFKYKQIDNGFVNFNDRLTNSDFGGEFNKKINIEGRPLMLFIDFIIHKIKKSENIKEKAFHFSIEDFRLYKKHKSIAPIRAKPKRLYESYKTNFSSDGEHIPGIIKDIFLSNDIKLINKIQDFGKKSGLYDEIKINELGSKKGISPFEINIKYNQVETKLTNVGYGVSQSLPIITEILTSKNFYFSIQQPEVHLHPRAQSALGEFFAQSAVDDKNKFIIETHSDFIIDRFRYFLSKNTNTGINSNILFFQKKNQGNTITRIGINKDGLLIGDIPTEYRGFFIDEQIKLLDM